MGSVVRKIEGPSIVRFAGECDEAGRRLVVRNGYHEPREVLTSAGAVEVVVPRVNVALVSFLWVPSADDRIPAVSAGQSI